MQESECDGNIHFNKKKHEYMVITMRNLIFAWKLHHRVQEYKNVKDWEDAHKLAKLLSWTGQKETAENDLLLIWLLHKECMVLRLRVHFVSHCGIWTCKPRVVRRQPNEYIKWSQMACTKNHTWWSNVSSSSHTNMDWTSLNNIIKIESHMTQVN